MICRKGADAPSAEHVVLQEAARYRSGHFLGNNSTCQQMSRIGADGFDLPPFRIQPKRKEVLVGHPVTIVETLLQLRGFMEEMARQFPVAHEPQHLRHTKFGYIHEGLLFTSRDRRIDLAAIFVNNGISGVLPSLISVALFRTALIVVEAISEPIGILVL